MRIRLSDFLPEGGVVSPKDVDLLLRANAALDTKVESFEQDTSDGVREAKGGALAEHKLHMAAAGTSLEAKLN